MQPYLIPSCVPCRAWIGRGGIRLREEKFDLMRNAVRYAASVPHGYARALADDGKWEYAVACPGVPSDVLVDAVEGVINE